MAEVIESIEEIENFAPDPANEWDRCDGFKIVTNEQEIRLGISNSQSCCEDWGYLLTEDDPSKFVGAQLRGIALTDTNRSSRKFIPPDKESGHYDDDAVYLDSGDVMFVDIETDRGVLQFVAYNAHNGYYGHSAYVSSTQLKHEVGL